MSVAAVTDDLLPSKWVNSLWPEIPDGEWLSIFAMTPDGQDRQTLWAQTTTQAAGLIRRHTATHNVWLGCATRTRNMGPLRGSAADCGHIPGLWLDVDIQGPHHSRQDLPPTVEAALAVIDAFPVPPTVIVHSGNGLQPWWLFTEPARPADYPELLDAWSYTWTRRFTEAGYGLDNVFDVARVLRVAGTLNHKNDPPAPVTVHTVNKGAKYEADDIDHWLDTPPAPQPRAAGPLVPYIGPARPGDAFNAAHNGADILEQAGWDLARTDRNGDRHYRHPNATSPTSATVYADDGHTTIWTDSFPKLEPRRPYDPFGLYTALHHEGDWRAAAQHLGANGYGTRPVTAADLIDATTPGTAPAPTRVQALEYRIVDAFWQARPYLEHIRTAAHARYLPADALLGAVLTRVSYLTPPQLLLPAIVGSHGSLDVIHAIVGPSGMGKTQAMRAARDLLPGAPGDQRDGLPIGSGEGVIEAYYGMVEVVGDDGKKMKERQQVHTAALFEVDEGQILGALGERSGSTLFTNLRSAWSGGNVGQTNASADRTRLLKAGRYRFAMIVGIQPEKADALLGDAAGGTPQRFCWFTATDPDAPYTRPSWPGALDWRAPQRSVHDGHSPTWEMAVTPAIEDEVKTTRHLLLTTGKADVESHAYLLRLKLAGLLALLDRRTHITDLDWELAGMIHASSVAVRDHMTAAIANEKTQAHAARQEADVALTIGIEEALEARAVLSMARSIARKAWAGGEMTKRDAAAACNSAHRRAGSVDDALDHAVIEGWIRVVEGVVSPGAVKPPPSRRVTK